MEDSIQLTQEFTGESPLCTPTGKRKIPQGRIRKAANPKGDPQQDGKKKKRRRKRRVVINTTYCKYDIVRKVAYDNDWVEDSNEDGEKGEFNIFWTDTSVAIYRVMKLQNWQRINHFPSMHTIARKVQLANILGKMGKLFPQHFSFSPRTWSLRSERNIFKKFIQTLPQKKTFIVKPSAGCKGKGIFLTQDVQDLSEDIEDAVVQEYIMRPLLIEDKKFDLRVYALITSCKHLGIFIFNEGLVKLCTLDYQKPAEDNMSMLQMHLTNYAINKTSEHFVFNEDAENGGVGHKRDFAFLNRWLAKEGHDPQKMWRRIDKVIIKTLVSAQPILSHVYTSCFPHNNDGYTCFEILGFDLLIDQQLRPWLLEVNHSASFTCDTPLDEKIKTDLIRETVDILNLKQDDRWREREREKDEFKRRMDIQTRRAIIKKAGGDDAELRELEREELETERRRQEEFVKEKRKEEDSLLKNFRRIYPCKDPVKQQLYEEFIEGAKEVNAPSSTVATVQREQEGKKEREKQREKQEKEDALRRGLQRPRSPPSKRDKCGDRSKMGDDGRQGMWQQKLDQQMERHKRRISLGPRLSVFQLRDQYMTVPTGLSLFDKPADTLGDDSVAPQVPAGAMPSTSAHIPSHSNYSVYPLKLIDCPSHPLNPPSVPSPPEPSQPRAQVPVRKETVSLTYVMAPSVMPTPKLAPSGRTFKQLKAL